MNIRQSIRIVVPFSLLLSACVSAPPALGPLPPVGVVFSADPAVRHYVRTTKLTEITNQALRKYASSAGPATVTVRFTSLAAMPDPNSQIDVRSYPEQVVTQPSVVIVSAEPWNEGVRQRERTYMPGPAPGLRSWRQAVKGRYVIADASGKVLEEKPLYIGLDYHDGPGDRVLGEERQTAEYLAKRVAKLMGKQQS
jgi:hypothetical protein